MKKNVIILTHGWTGSSVFSALIGKAGYWKGDNTHKKPDYDTHENKELIQLNNRLMEELGFEGDHEHEFSLETIENMAKRAEGIDLSPYQAFVDKCEQNKPWIWKDPRLTASLRRCSDIANDVGVFVRMRARKLVRRRIECDIQIQATAPVTVCETGDAQLAFN